MPKTAKNPADYILPLNMNGLSGRMIRMLPPKGKTSEILYIYGHHSSLERYFGVADYLNQYAGVTVPDLPGFGGMDPFYKIGEKPSLDNMADYLAAFIKLRYKNKRFSIAGFSLGFMIVTRMLQKHPEIAEKIDILLSQTGFTHKGDFVYNRRTFFIFRWTTSVLSNRLPAAFVKYIVFRPIFIRIAYKFLEPLFVKAANSKIRDGDKEEYKKRVDFEIHLWQCNDPRTYMDIAVSMFTLDLTGQHINLAVHHVTMDHDRYFNNVKVEQHMRAIYKDFQLVKSKGPAHAPSILATAKEAEPYIPRSLLRLLNKKN